MTTAAIYARLSSPRQKEDQTIASQTAALHEAAERSGLEVPPEWVFEDEGYSGATLIRPALAHLRDLAAPVPIDVVLCYSPDRLARRYAYQALLIDEFARAGTEVRFVNGPKGESPEDELLIQFQGMIAEYERAQIVERTRRGKAHRARAGTVNVLSGAPFGYHYLRRSDTADARYEIVEEQAAVVREMFRRYTEDQDSIAELARWLSAQGVVTATGKDRWDRSTVWGMLRNPAYAGRAAFLKTMRLDQRARVNRTARLQDRSVSRQARSPPVWRHAAWRTTAASRRATPRCPRCSWASCRARAVATRTTGRRHAPRSASSTTTGVSAPTTTATNTVASATTGRFVPTTSTTSSGVR